MSFALPVVSTSSTFTNSTSLPGLSPCVDTAVGASTLSSSLGDPTTSTLAVAGAVVNVAKVPGASVSGSGTGGSGRERTASSSSKDDGRPPGGVTKVCLPLAICDWSVISFEPDRKYGVGVPTG